MRKKMTQRRVNKLGVKRLVSLLLSVCIMLAAMVPAFAVESGKEVIENSAEIVNKADDNAESPTDKLEDFTVGDEDEPVDEDEEPEEEPEPEPEVHTVTYDMGPLGKKTEKVEHDLYPREVPEPELEAALFLGWFDKDDNLVNPDSIFVTEDVTYYARFERNIDDILETVEHKSYINGYSEGTFKPYKGITRAESAKIFYSLLKTQDYNKKTFIDVKAGQWFADAVGVMAQLGIVGGYNDGYFYPNRVITRAEFVKMAAGFDTLETGKNIFSDVKAGSWYERYVVSATTKGWINGYSDGTFKPNAPITREEAVTVVNKMLKRYPDSEVKTFEKAKSFFDVYTNFWSYGQIMEASNSHEYWNKDDEAKTEVWTEYEIDDTYQQSRWITDSENRYYLDGKTKKFLRGTQKVDGIEYIFDNYGRAFTGFKMVGGYQRYYKQGRIVNDISKLGLVSGPYYIKVYKPANYLIVYAKDKATGKFNIPVKAMLTSCGVSTPTGTYYTPNKYRWLRMEGYTWSQWCTQISGNYLFHSVPNWTYNNMDLEVHEYNNLGTTRSMGCIRLNCADAKWIYDNCKLGTQTYISGSETSGPLAKPAGLKIPSWHTWDPTDPTAYYMCVRRGCH